jgi:hypothetical protein
MKIIGILSSFATVITMIVIYMNYNHEIETQNLRMQLQIEKTIMQAVLN